MKQRTDTPHETHTGVVMIRRESLGYGFIMDDFRQRFWFKIDPAQTLPECTPVCFRVRVFTRADGSTKTMAYDIQKIQLTAFEAAAEAARIRLNSVAYSAPNVLKDLAGAPNQK